MKTELRADGLHISGYVNVTGKMSRPVITGKGQKVIEVIEERAFQKALAKVDNVQMTKDHDSGYVLCETRAGNLKLKEDAIGLHADALITDEQTIKEAKEGKLKGWSFGMKRIIDRLEERADSLPIRHVSEFDLDHITLVVHKRPVYAATSIEMRADDDETDELELRASEEQIEVVDKTEKLNSKYHERLEKIKQTL